ncbi:MAG: hypothetical protein V8S77_01975 [Oscillospiraceae bacterium]
MSDPSIYDLRRDEDGDDEACVSRGALDGDVTLAVEEMDGSRYRIPLTVTHWEDIWLTSDGQLSVLLRDFPKEDRFSL